MPTPAEYRSRAAECDDLARITKDLGMREALLDLAAEWRACAAEDDAPPRHRRIWVDPALTPGRRSDS